MLLSGVPFDMCLIVFLEDTEKLGLNGTGTRKPDPVGPYMIEGLLAQS